MVNRAKPVGIRPDGAGIRVTVWRKGAAVYDKTIPGDYYNKGDLSSAIKHREKIVARKELGLPLSDRDSGTSQHLFSVAAQDFLVLMTELKPSTAFGYENIINQHWMPAFANWSLSEITQLDILRVISPLKLAPQTKKNLLHPLSGIFELHKIAPNPATGIKIKAKQKAKVERYTIAERSTLLQRLEGQHKVYFAILFGCGLRPGGEVVSLKWDDYTGEELSVSKIISRGQLQDSTKTNKARMVYVPTWVREILNAHPTRFQGGYIFQSPRGSHYADGKPFNRAWKVAHRQDIPYRIPYVCRHTRAAELLSQCIEPADAADQLGHSVTTFLGRYSEFRDEYAKNQDKSRFEGVGIGAGREGVK